jgi:hypothetical protein
MEMDKKPGIRLFTLRPDIGGLIHLFAIFFLSLSIIIIGTSSYTLGETIDLGLSSPYFKEGQVPEGWKLKKVKGYTSSRVSAGWAREDGIKGVKLESYGSLTFLQKKVSIDLEQFPIVTWRWKVDTVLEGIDERTIQGDDHPIRIFFVFEPDNSKQSLWFRIKRALILDMIHGHPVGGRFTEYLWSSYLESGEIINDPSKPKQKLMVVEGGNDRIGKWIEYKKNLYEDFLELYGERPRKLIFIGIINDTDITQKKATSYIADLRFHTRQ